MAVSVWAQLY